MASELFSPGGPLAYEDPDLTDEERALARRLAALRGLEPSEAYRRRAAAELKQRIEAEPTRAAGLFWWLWLPQRRPPLALQFALVLCIVLPGLFGISFAAAASLPGDSLYSLKRGVEDVRVSLSAPSNRTALLLDLAAQRLSEIGQLVARGADAEQIVRAAAEYQAAVERAAAQSPLAPDDIAALRRQIAILATLEAQAPATAQSALEGARRAAERAAGGTPGTEPPPARPTEATATPLPSSTPRPTARPTSTATPRPAPSATPRPSATPTTEPTYTPTARPSATPRPKPRATPRPKPTAKPPAETPTPEAVPVVEPPTAEPPTAEPPTATPSPEPSAPPTEKPRHREPRPTAPPREPTAPPREPTAPPREPTAPPREPTHEPTARPTEPPRRPTATPRR